MDKVLVLHFQFYIKGNLSDLDLFVHRSSKMQGGGSCDNSIKAATSHLHMDSPGDGMKCSLLSVLFRDFFLGKTFPSQVSQSVRQPGMKISRIIFFYFSFIKRNCFVWSEWIDKESVCLLEFAPKRMLIVENILNVNCSKYFCLKCTKDCGDKKVKKLKNTVQEFLLLSLRKNYQGPQLSKRFVKLELVEIDVIISSIQVNMFPSYWNL